MTEEQDVSDDILTGDLEDTEGDEPELPNPIDHLPVEGAEGLPDDVKNGDAEVPTEEP